MWIFFPCCHTCILNTIKHIVKYFVVFFCIYLFFCVSLDTDLLRNTLRCSLLAGKLLKDNKKLIFTDTETKKGCNMSPTHINPDKVKEMIESILDKGVSKSEIYRKALVSRSFIHKVLTGNPDKVRYATVKAIADAFHFETKIDNENNEVTFIPPIIESTLPESLVEFMEEHKAPLSKIFDLVELAGKFGVNNSDDLQDAVLTFLKKEIGTQQDGENTINTKNISYQKGIITGGHNQ